MCGIFYALSKEKEISFNDDEISYIIEKIKYRGPDNTNIVKDPKAIYIHTLLAIQGFNPQPYLDGNNLLLFNGEIYSTSEKKYANTGWTSFSNEYDRKISEGEFLSEYLKEHDFRNLGKLDGEYVINYFDKNNNKLHIITDPFGTKPFYIFLNDSYLIGSSYVSCIQRALDILKIQGEILSVIPNTHYLIDLSYFVILNREDIVKWDFNPKYKSFDRWEKAFKNSLLKRSNSDKKFFIPLSSGYDSGCITAGLINLKKNFTAYSFKGSENKKILEARKYVIQSHGSNFQYVHPDEDAEDSYENYCKRIENCLAYHQNGEIYANIYNAYGCFGQYKIFEKARESESLIFFSGQGGDEIFSDYGNISNRSASCLNMNFRNIRSKWPNFDSSYGRNILQMVERVAGAYGIEARYPFLDINVVQEFLWLHDDIKNKEFKQCIAQYMRKSNFPFEENKKCSVRVFEEDRGGNTKFTEIAHRVQEKLGIFTQYEQKPPGNNYLHWKANGIKYYPKHI